MTPQEIKEKIENCLPGSTVEVLDPRRDGVHLKAIVVWKGFAGMGLVDQHRKVYDCLREELKEELHALGLETRVE